MMTIVRLCWTYFTATTWCRVLSAIGLIVVVGAILFPAAVARTPHMTAVCFAGAAALFLGSSMMPVAFGRMAASHQLAFLPFGRVKLIVSALLTTTLVVIPVPVMGMLISIESFSKYALQTKLSPKTTLLNFLTAHFTQMCLVAFLWTTWMYFVLWSLTTSRNALGMLRTLLLLIALIAIPPRYGAINNHTPVGTILVLIIASWTLFIGYFLLLPRLRRSRLHATYQSIREGWRGRDVSAKELPLLLGISSPRLLALVVAICIVLDSLFVPLRGPWLFFLVILALVSGAIAGKTAARSRALWLRLPHTRAELFARVERLLWQHTAPSIAILVAWLATIGTYSNLPAWTIPVWIFYGAPLIVLAAGASLYLGLMQTTGLRVMDATIAIVVTLTAMGIALYAVDNAEPAVVMALEAALLTATVAFRAMAKARWIDLDWILCRAERGVAAYRGS